MLYGKIIDGKFKFAPDTYLSNDGNIVLSNFNTNQELMYEFGYKPVVEIYPETTLDLEMLKIYEEKEDKIVVTYSVNNTERYLNSVLPYMMVNEPIPESIKIYWNSMGCVCE